VGVLLAYADIRKSTLLLRDPIVRAAESAAASTRGNEQGEKAFEEGDR
jgi:hypothetical protein